MQIKASSCFVELTSSKIDSLEEQSVNTIAIFLGFSLTDFTEFVKSSLEEKGLKGRDESEGKWKLRDVDESVFG